MTASRFKIIRDNEEEFEASFRQYQDYLSKITRPKSSDFWRFFQVPYFHDGDITEFKFNPMLRELSFNVSCLTIRHRDEEIYKKHGYCPMIFNCSFGNISWIQFDMGNQDDASAWGYPVMYFQYCEIETLINFSRRHKSCDEIKHSLIISTSEPKIYISLIFESYNVRPLEDAAFYQMLTSA